MSWSIDRVCSRRGCFDLAEKKNSATTYYCYKHHRIRQMRCDSKKRGKIAPSIEFLEAIWSETCGECGKETSRDGRRGDRLSIQHYSDGRIGLICVSCNSVSGNSASGDDVFLIERGKKQCGRCREVKDPSLFGRCASRRDGKHFYCRDCVAEINNKRYVKKSTCANS